MAVAALYRYLRSLAPNTLITFFLRLSSGLALGFFLLATPKVAGQSLAYAPDPYGFPAYDSTGRKLSLAWSGGLNSPQFSRAELNGDGRKDLVAYDRYTGQVHAFVATDSGLVWSPEAAERLNARVESWALLADYDGDGQEELFTAHPFGIQVYDARWDNGSLSWRSVTTELGEVYLQAVTTDGLTNIQVSRSDLPALYDVDGDGDLDLWVFNFATGVTVSYFQNVSVETNGVPGALRFNRMSTYWGGMSDCGCDLVVVDGVACRPTQAEHAGGKTLLMLPQESGGPGVIFGDELCDEPTWMANAGDDIMPSLSEVNLLDSLHDFEPITFPTAYQLGPDTLIIATNLAEDLAYEMDFSRSVQRYARTDSGYVRMTSRWLQEDMVDVGTQAVPAWVDIDLDGDQDLLVAQAGPGPALHVWENRGTDYSPELHQGPNYTIVEGLVDWRVWVADLTGGGTPEVIVAGREPNRSAYQFYWAHFGEDMEPQWQPWDFTLFNGEQLTFGDLESDGFLDALIGMPAGRVRHLVATSEDRLNPVWEEVTPSFGGLGDEIERLFVRPFLADLDQDGRLDLLLTTNSGAVEWYPAVEGRALLLARPFLNDASGQAFRLPPQAAVAPAFVNLDAPAYLTVGLPGGGIRWYRPTVDIPAPEFPTWKVYPNPATDQITIRTSQAAEAILISPQGQEVLRFSVVAQELQTFDVTQVPRGLFLLRLMWEGGSSQSQWVIFR